MESNINENDVLNIMNNEYIHQIPMLDSDGRVIHLFIKDELTKSQNLKNTIIIMAGGEGKRLRPFTKNIPKPMIQIKGKPLLEIILEQCIKFGFNQFKISVNYLKDHIIEYFQDGSKWCVNIDYICVEVPLGTAGSLGLIKNKFDLPFMVINADVLTLVPFSNLLKFHEENSAKVTICVREHYTYIPYGIVHTKGSTVNYIEEKPTISHFVNAGVYVFSPDVLSYVTPESHIDMPQYIQLLKDSNLLVQAFPIHEYWLDIGYPDKLKQAHDEWHN